MPTDSTLAVGGSGSNAAMTGIGLFLIGLGELLRRLARRVA